MRRDGEKPRRDSGLSPPRQPGSPTATALHPRASRRAPWTVTASRPAVPSWALASAPDSLSVNPVDSDLNSRESTEHFMVNTAQALGKPASQRIGGTRDSP